VRPKASRAGLMCRTDQYFQRQRLPYTCWIKTVKSVRKTFTEWIWVWAVLSLMSRWCPMHQSHLTSVRVLMDPGKSWNLQVTFSRPGKSWNPA